VEINMTQPADEQASIEEQAAIWHARLDAPDMDWDGFGAWLDADPAHRGAYDAVALLDAEIGAARTEIMALSPANDLEPVAEDRPKRGRWMFGGGAAIAAALAVLIVPQLTPSAIVPMTAYHTGPAETRTLTLKDGSHVVMDRNTSVALRDGETPRIELAGGAAYFDIRHDPSRSLTVAVGDYEVRDIGTRFDVSRSSSHLTVAVADGQVTFAPTQGSGTTLTAGKRIDVAFADNGAVVRHVDPTAVGQWQRGRLVYDNAPLALVAADVSRYAGKTVRVDPAVADMRMSGVLTIGDGSRLVGQIEALLPVKALSHGGRIDLVGTRAH
jgi:transmembrane sensor